MESDARDLAEAIAVGPARQISAATVVEVGIVMVARHGHAGGADRGDVSKTDVKVVDLRSRPAPP